MKLSGMRETSPTETTPRFQSLLHRMKFQFLAADCAMFG